jgi:hypothetical protein
MTIGPDYNGDGSVSKEEAERYTKETASQAASNPIAYSSFPSGGYIVIPGFGKRTTKVNQPSGAPQYASVTEASFGDYIGGSASQAKGLFTVLAQKNDKRLLAWMQSMGVDNFTDGRKLWDKAVDYAADIAYTGKKVDLFKSMTSNSFISENSKLFESFGGGSARPSRYVSLTNVETAKQQLQKDMRNLLGRDATDKEATEYVKKLHAAQTKNASTVNYGGTTQTTVSSTFDEDAFTLGFILNKAGGKFDAGTLKASLESVKALAREYGVTPATTNTKFKQLTKQLIMNETSDEALREQFAATAASLFPAWSPYMEKAPTKSLSQLASDYTNVYANMLEMDEDQVDILDVLNKATAQNPDGTSKVVSLSEMQKALRKDDRFKFTSMAKREAADYGATLARMSGVNL